MKPRPLETIKSLIKYLTKKDNQIAEKLIAAKDYDSLKELVDSAIIRAKKSLNSDSPKQEYLNLNMGKLEELKVAVYEYLDFFNFDDEDEDDIDYCDENLLSEFDDTDLLEAAGIW